MLKRSDFSDKQLEILDWESLSESVVIAHGAGRSGKTATIGHGNVRYSAMFQEPANFLLFSKDLPKIKNVMIEALIEAATSMGIPYDKYRNQEKYIQIGKHRFFAFSADDRDDLEAIRGFEFASAWGDEATSVRPEFVQMTFNRFSNPELPAKLFLSCNPKDPRHWIKRDFIDRAEERNFKEVKFLWSDNPYLVNEFPKKNNGKTWDEYQLEVLEGAKLRQLLYSEWVSDEGLVYPHYTEYKILDTKADDTFVSIDVGWDEPTHVLLVERHNDIYYVSDELRIINKDNPISPSRQCERIMDFVGDRDIKAFVIDSAAADMKAQLLQDYNVRCINSNKKKQFGIQATRHLLSNNKLQINENCIDLTNELGGYLWDPNKLNYSIEEPIKGNDHAVDALRYFCATIVSRRRKDRKKQLKV